MEPGSRSSNTAERPASFEELVEEAAGEEPLEVAGRHRLGPHAAEGGVLDRAARDPDDSDCQGAVDWRRLLRAAREAGVERGFVELEPPYLDYTALDAAKAAHAYLQALDD